MAFRAFRRASLTKSNSEFPKHIFIFREFRKPMVFEPLAKKFHERKKTSNNKIPCKIKIISNSR